MRFVSNIDSTMNVAILKRYRESNSQTSNTNTNETTAIQTPNTVATSTRRIKKKNYLCERPDMRLSDLGGLDYQLVQNIKEWIERPLFYPQIYTCLGIEPPRGVLICGPSGCGKTSLALAIAGEYNLPFIKISATEIISGMSGESESKLRDIFDEATKNAPCILFIDEIDAIITKRELAQREMERRIVSQLGTCMDSLGYASNEILDSGYKPVIILAATNRPDALDPVLRRAGRFDHEIKMGIPNEQSRKEILQLFMNRLRTDDHSVQIKYLARHTPGYTGSDLKMLIREAAMQAIKRVFDNNHIDRVESRMIDESLDTNNTVNHIDQSLLDELLVTHIDFISALNKIQPSAKREGFAVVPDVTWSDIGALHNVRQELRLAIVEPIRQPELYASVGLSRPSGVLLWGPPGCGKTLLAKAVANQSHSNFISVKGPELLNKYVGESERAVRQVFERARLSAPCVIFFDELDALCPRRDDDSGSGNYSARVVNQLLTEMDGLESRQQVYVLGATNRPDIIDPAMLRPGRLDKLIHVQLPNAEERYDILLHQTKMTPLDATVDLKAIAYDPRTEGFSGADLSALVREASLVAIQGCLLCDSSITIDDDMAIFQKNNIVPNIKVSDSDFKVAFSKVHASVTTSARKLYESINSNIGTQ